MKLQQIIGNNIKAFRKLRGITQEELAKKSRTHKAYIGFIERGERNISVETLNVIATALEVSPYVLLIPEAKQWLK